MVVEMDGDGIGGGEGGAEGGFSFGEKRQEFGPCLCCVQRHRYFHWQSIMLRELLDHFILEASLIILPGPPEPLDDLMRAGTFRLPSRVVVA